MLTAIFAFLLASIFSSVGCYLFLTNREKASVVCNVLCISAAVTGVISCWWIYLACWAASVAIAFVVMVVIPRLKTGGKAPVVGRNRELVR